MVELINNYLNISPEIFETCLKSENNIYFVYYSKIDKLLIAPVSEEYFKQLHQCQATFLKLKNSKGIRNFQIANILLDHDIHSEDRVLEYKIEGHILSINLKEKK